MTRGLASALLILLLCPELASAQSALRTVHVFVALADNAHQGIVPVPAKLGNGEDAERNLYWGSAGGVKTFFSRATEWERVGCGLKAKAQVLDRCVFKFRAANVYLIADAYRGTEIKQAITDFLDSAAGDGGDTVSVSDRATGRSVELPAHGAANLVAYAGHDGLMDFQLVRFPRQRNDAHRDAVVLACASKQFFSSAVRVGGAYPLLWTTGLMAPEAYTLKAALDGWIAGETNEQVRERAAAAYDRYQKCGLKAARRLFATGW